MNIEETLAQYSSLHHEYEKGISAVQNTRTKDVEGSLRQRGTTRTVVS